MMAPNSRGMHRPQRPPLHVVPPPRPSTPPTGLTGRQQDVWLEVANEHGSVTEICVRLGLAKTRVYEVLTELRQGGHVRAVVGGRGRYEITR